MFGFRTPDEMVIWLGRQMLSSQAEANREPVELQPGDHWLRVVDFVPEVVVIFGRVDEVEAPGFYFGPVHSELNPDGHFSIVQGKQLLMKISEEDFEAARAARWELLPLILEGREFASQVMQLAGLEE